MTLYAGLDVGSKATHLCLVDGEGVILWRGACATDPEALAFALRKHAPGLARAVLETGAPWPPCIGAMRAPFTRACAAPAISGRPASAPWR